MRIPEGEIPAITGVGHGVGRNVITNAAFAEYIGRKPETIERLMAQAGIGIEQRFWVEKGEQATSDLCVDAFEEALAMANLEKGDVKSLYVATFSPDYQAVSAAAIVQEKLGLPTTVLGSNNSDACPGWIFAAHRAMSDLTSPLGRGGVAVVIGAETISPLLSKKKPLVSALFGDAAGATIWQNVKPDSDDLRNYGFGFGVDGKYAEELLIRGGGSKHFTTEETLANDWHSLDMNGKLIFDQAVKRMSEATRQALDDAGIPLEEIDVFVPHQANRKIIEATAEALGVPMEKVIVTIDRYGNTSAASIPTAMYEGVRSGKIERNMIVATAAFGAGLSYGSAIFPMVGLPERDKQVFQGVDVYKK